MIKKIIVEQLRGMLKDRFKPEAKKPDDPKKYLDFLNLGVYVDLDRVKEIAFRLIDGVLDDISQQGKKG